MTDLIGRIDPASLPLLGLFGAFACGPVAPSQGESGTDGGAETDPTATTDPTEPTTTTPPTPECEHDSDCGDLYCGYCVEGRCEESVGCCGVRGAEQMEDGKWRCSLPYDGCYYGYEICPDGYVCEFNECVMGPTAVIPLPSCRPPDLETRVWNLGDAPGALALADVDGDLDLDILVAHPQLGVLELGLNDGAASITSSGTIDVGAAPTLGFAAGDLDGDGDLDLAVVRGGEAGVLRLLFNDGATFTVGAELPAGNFLAAVHLADVDGDAALDVVTIDASGVLVRLGDGMGGLGSSIALAGTVSTRASVVDVSSDGVADLLLPIADGPEVQTWLGQTDGILVQSRTFVTAGSGGAPLAADLDGQGASDVVVVQPDDVGDVIEVWLASEPLGWPDLPARYTTHTQLRGGLLAELDGNPGPDLVGVTGVDHVALIPGDGKGGFVCDHLQPTIGESAASLLAVGDLDGDGRHDIVAGGASSAVVSLVLLK